MARLSSPDSAASCELVLAESTVCCTVCSVTSRMPVTERLSSSATSLCCAAATAICVLLSRICATAVVIDSSRLRRLARLAHAIVGLERAFLHELDGIARHRLQIADHAGDLVGGVLHASGEVAYLIGDYREATACLAGARGFDGGR